MPQGLRLTPEWFVSSATARKGGSWRGPPCGRRRVHNALIYMRKTDDKTPVQELCSLKSDFCSKIESPSGFQANAFPRWR